MDSTTSTSVDAATVPLIARPAQDPTPLSPLATAAVSISCVAVAIAVALVATYGFYRLTWQKKRSAIQHSDPAGLLPNRRITKSASFGRQISVLPATEQFYEGLTPEKREMLDKLRNQQTPTAFFIHGRRSLAPPQSVPITRKIRKMHTSPSREFVHLPSCREEISPLTFKVRLLNETEEATPRPKSMS